MFRNKTYVELRLAALNRNPVENYRLIKKWERYLRKIKD